MSSTRCLASSKSRPPSNVAGFLQAAKPLESSVNAMPAAVDWSLSDVFKWNPAAQNRRTDDEVKLRDRLERNVQPVSSQITPLGTPRGNVQKAPSVRAPSGEVGVEFTHELIPRFRVVGPRSRQRRQLGKGRPDACTSGSERDSAGSRAAALHSPPPRKAGVSPRWWRAVSGEWSKRWASARNPPPGPSPSRARSWSN